MSSHIVIGAPGEDLAPCVAAFQWIERTARRDALARVPPVAAWSFVFQMRGAVAYRAARDAAFTDFPRAFVAGVAEHPLELRVPPDTRVFRVVMQPHFTEAVLSRPAAHFVNRIVDLADIGEDMGLLAQAMISVPDFTQAVALFENWLRRRLRRFRAPPLFRLAPVVERLLRAQDVLHVHDLAADLGIGTRQLARRFIRTVGLPPKRFQRVARLNAVLAALGDDSEPDWAALAHRFGFTDQPHMVREFVALTGMPPGQLLRDARLAQLLLQIQPPPEDDADAELPAGMHRAVRAGAR